MTFGSLFAGIGGMDLGLERAGMECRWQVEIDPFCQRVLAKHWPDVKRYGDIRGVDWTAVERVDLIAGGFPCQDISNAGKRAGIEGERSGLWSEYARALGELRPRYVLVENVSALLSRGVDRVLGDLATLGYDAEWDCIPAAAVGAPHIRDRVWIVGHADRDGQSAGAVDAQAPWLPGVVADSEGIGSALRATEGGRAGRPTGGRPAMAHANIGERAQPGADERVGRIWLPSKADRDGGRGRPSAGGDEWATEPEVGRVADGFPSRMDELRGLGNAVVPQVAEWIGRRILEAAH